MSDHIIRLQTKVDEIFQHRQTIRVLEAGCGSMSFVDLKEKATIVGIDISLQQLQRNKSLHEAIHGDIMNYVFPPDSFDAIVCIDVLEHLDRPELALENFRAAVAAGGIVILKLPNVWSLKGLLTKLSPHWFHVWFYRTIYGRKDAGRGDTAPFKTFLKLAVGPPRLRRWCRDNRLGIVYEDYYESGYQKNLKKKLKVMGVISPILERIVRILSFGNLSFERTEYVLVFQKPNKEPAAI